MFISEKQYNAFQNWTLLIAAIGCQIRQHHSKKSELTWLLTISTTKILNKLLNPVEQKGATMLAVAWADKWISATRQPRFKNAFSFGQSLDWILRHLVGVSVNLLSCDFWVREWYSQVPHGYIKAHQEWKSM